MERRWEGWPSGRTKTTPESVLRNPRPKALVWASEIRTLGSRRGNSARPGRVYRLLMPHGNAARADITPAEHPRTTQSRWHGGLRRSSIGGVDGSSPVPLCAHSGRASNDGGREFV